MMEVVAVAVGLVGAWSFQGVYLMIMYICSSSI